MNTVNEKVVTEKVVTEKPSTKTDDYTVELPICVQAAAWGVTFATVAYTATALVKLFSKD